MKISIFILFLAIIFPSHAFAVPAYDDFFALKQPSGISFEARQRGDEWYNWIETKDGYGIYLNSSTGNWEYYTPSLLERSETTGKDINATLPSGAIVGKTDPVLLNIPKGLRPSRTSYETGLLDTGQEITQKKDSYTKPDAGLKSTARSGAMYLLAIGVDYATTTATYSPEQVQPLFFGESNCVSDYYSKASYSAVTVNPATESYGTQNDGFIGWLRLDGSHPNTSSGASNQKITKEAILVADPYIDYSQYDNDGNGIVEPTELAIVIIVAGYERAVNPYYTPSIWAHYSSMGSIGYPTVDNKTIQRYAQFGEIHYNHLATFGVIAHELGHLMFSLPDLYDTVTSNGDSEGVGYFDLMGSGSWGAKYGEYGGSSPTFVSAWSKEYLSWGTVTAIYTNQSVSFPKADDNTSIFRMNTTHLNQYFLLENRDFSSYDIGFQRKAGETGHGGLVIYHIDTQKTSLWPSSNKVNADGNDKGVDVEEANEGSLGYSMLDTNAYQAHTNMFFFSGNNTSFTDTTTPNSKLKNGDATNISVTDISSYGETMTATVTVPALPPTVTTGSATNLTSNSATLNGTVNAHGIDTTVWFEYDTTSGSFQNTSTTQSLSNTSDTTVSIVISGLTTNTTYYYRIAAQNSAGTSYGSEMSFISPDTTPPNGEIVINGGATYSNSTSITISLSATDDVGVTDYYISTNSTTPSLTDAGWNSVNATTSYTDNVPYYLNNGDGIETLYVWYKDDAGNISSTAYDEIILDMTVPTVTIITPTADSTYTTTNKVINLGGSVYDETSGVSAITWNSSNGESGVASGIVNWSASGINLPIGDTTINVTATDNAGNPGTDTIIVTVSPCDATFMTVSSSALSLRRKESNTLAVTVTGSNTCPVEDITVSAKVNKTYKKYLSVSPADQNTDGDGNAIFNITARNKAGKARIVFSAGSLKKTITVRIKK